MRCEVLRGKTIGPRWLYFRLTLSDLISEYARGVTDGFIGYLSNKQFTDWIWFSIYCRWVAKYMKGPRWSNVRDTAQRCSGVRQPRVEVDEHPSIFTHDKYIRRSKIQSVAIHNCRSSVEIDSLACNFQRLQYWLILPLIAMTDYGLRKLYVFQTLYRTVVHSQLDENLTWHIPFNFLKLVEDIICPTISIVLKQINEQHNLWMVYLQLNSYWVCVALFCNRTTYSCVHLGIMPQNVARWKVWHSTMSSAESTEIDHYRYTSSHAPSTNMTTIRPLLLVFSTNITQIKP